MSPLPRGRSRATLTRELAAGLVAACLTAPLCIGAGILAFAPLGPEYTAHGALAGLYGAILGGAVAAIARRSSFVVTYPTTPICAIQAGFGASLLPLCGGRPTYLVAMTACLVLAGLLQALFAVSGLSRVIRWVPHPVMAGFVSGVAAFIAWHQLPALLGHRSMNDLFRAGAAPGQRLAHPLSVSFGALLVLAILLLPRLVPRLPGLLAGLVMGTFAWHAIHLGWPGADLGAVVGSLPSTLFDAWPTVTAASLASLVGDSGVLRTGLMGSLTLAIVGTLDTFFALRTAAFVADIPVAPRRDVLGQGAANLATAFLGVPVSTSLSVSIANHRAGGRTRWSTLGSAGALLVMALLFPNLLTHLPLVVVAAVLLSVAISLVDRWCFVVLREAVVAGDRPRRRRAVRDALVILAVFLSTVVGKPVTGVMVGIGLSGLLFVLDMSRPVLARRRDGATVRSKRLRSPAEQAALRAQGGRMTVLELQGALFFGNAQSLAADVEDVGRATSIVLLDCRRIRDIDTSGLAVLDQIALRLRKEGRQLIVAGASPEWVERTLSAATGTPDYVRPSLEAALEWAEEELLVRWRSAGNDVRTSEPAAPLSSVLDLLGPKLREHFVPETIPAGSAICRAGEAADRMWVLRRGTVRVEARQGPNRLLLTRLGPGSMIGEIGLVEQVSRSADVIAEEEVEAYVLTRESLSGVMAEDPEAGQAILLCVARQLARRVRELSGELGEA